MAALYGNRDTWDNFEESNTIVYFQIRNMQCANTIGTYNFLKEANLYVSSDIKQQTKAAECVDYWAFLWDHLSKYINDTKKIMSVTFHYGSRVCGSF